MPLILSIDTSTSVCSVALHRSEPNPGAELMDSTLLGCYELFTERTSAAMLTTLISEVVRHTGYELKQVDAIAVAKGPGSYTGLRIGVSTAKGLCFALDKPLLSVNTLAAMADQVRPFLTTRSTLPCVLCPMIDARRMEVYCAVYSSVDGSELQSTSAQIIDDLSFSDWLVRGPVVFFGDGAAKCWPILGHHPNADFVDQLIVPSARTVGPLAARAFAESRFEEVAPFEPFYLKEFMTAKPKKTVL